MSYREGDREPRSFYLCTHVSQCLCRVRGLLEDLAFSFPHVGPRAQTQVVRLAVPLYPLSHLDGQIGSIGMSQHAQPTLAFSQEFSVSSFPFPSFHPGSVPFWLAKMVRSVLMTPNNNTRLGIDYYSGAQVG